MSLETIIHLIVAGLILFGYAALIYSMFDRYVYADKEAANWEHAQTLLNGLNAIVFTAAGVLLGSSVQQSRTADVQAKNDKVATEVAKAAQGLDTKITRNTDGEPTGAGLSNADIALIKIGAVLGVDVYK